LSLFYRRQTIVHFKIPELIPHCIFNPVHSTSEMPHRMSITLHGCPPLLDDATDSGPIWFMANYITLCLMLFVQIEELTLDKKLGKMWQVRQRTKHALTIEWTTRMTTSTHWRTSSTCNPWNMVLQDEVDLFLDTLLSTMTMQSNYSDNLVYTNYHFCRRYDPTIYDPP
jgi:hypothetical protein